MRLGTCKTGLSPPVFYITDRSKGILLWWFLLFNALVFKHFCVVVALCVCNQIFRSVWLTEWPPIGKIGKIAAHSAYEMVFGISTFLLVWLFPASVFFCCCFLFFVFFCEESFSNCAFS